MELQLILEARDVTLLPDQRPFPDPNAVPEHHFEVLHGEQGYALIFDGNRVTVPDAEMDRLFSAISDTPYVDWQYSKVPEIKGTFRPISRVIRCLETTPSYQLFLARFHIADEIGMLALNAVDTETIPDSFRYLVGNIPWRRGKQGRLFILREGEILDQNVRQELIANGKLFETHLFVGDSNGIHQIAEKLIVPYATPIGFNTSVGPQTEKTWRRICAFVQKNGGGYVQ